MPSFSSSDPVRPCLIWHIVATRWTRRVARGGLGVMGRTVSPVRSVDQVAGVANPSSSAIDVSTISNSGAVPKIMAFVFA
jgi:hypothetical protein